MKTIGLGKKQGFTLIEIIIVVIILGILAAVALPKITANIGKAATTEAFNIGGEVAKAYDRCMAEQTAGSALLEDAAGNTLALLCDTFVELGMTPPPATKWNYVLTPPPAATTRLVLTATAVVPNTIGLTTNDVVTFTYIASAGTVTKTCSAGTLANMCKGG